MKGLLLCLALLVPALAQAECKSYTGLAIFALFNPKFPISEAGDVLTNIECPVFNVLWGTFGRQFDNADYLIHRITRAGTSKETLQIGVYVDCEPCRRPRRDGSLEHFRKDLTVDQFRALIRAEDTKLLADWDARLDDLYAFMSRYLDPRTSTYLSWKKPPKIQWRIYPVLEDNLSESEYNILKSRTSARFQVTPIRPVVARNRMKPYSGTDPSEIHSYNAKDIAILKPGDAVNGDGILTWPRKELVAQLRKKGIFFLLWDKMFQGTQGKTVMDRYYYIDDAQKIIRFLK